MRLLPLSQAGCQSAKVSFSAARLDAVPARRCARGQGLGTVIGAGMSEATDRPTGAIEGQ